MDLMSEQSLSTITLSSGPLGPVKVRTVYSGPDSNDTMPTNITWSPVTLIVDDNIYYGTSRDVIVNLGQSQVSPEYSFLQSVNPLYKTEFEDIFGFEPGQFVKGRIIRLLSEHIKTIDR